jgi:Fe-Mn family superoxide dismutase
MDLKKYRDIIQEVQTTRETLVLEKLPYGLSDLEPVMSKETLELHYKELANAYVNRYNNKEGDDNFNYGGATLHNLFFPMLRSPKAGNKPDGTSEQLINKEYGNFEKFKDEFIKTAMGIQGSGWIYMDVNGNIKTIANQGFKKGMRIALLVDMWEHSYVLDYGHKKAKYLENIWKIINWTTVNDRLQGE